MPYRNNVLSNFYGKISHVNNISETISTRSNTAFSKPWKAIETFRQYVEFCLTTLIITNYDFSFFDATEKIF